MSCHFGYFKMPEDDHSLQYNKDELTLIDVPDDRRSTTGLLQ